MKFSYNTIQGFFKEKLPEPEKLGEIIGLHSFELEGVEKVEKENSYQDYLIDWDILPNRSSDCLCYMGIVKEVSAVLNIPYIDFQDEYKNHNFSSNFKTSDFINLEVEDSGLIKKATKRIAKNVKIKKSPEWLVNFLESIGQKSINNVVDITNYTMFITGQPVHAFDYDKIIGEGRKNIYIKKAENNQKVKDLTGLEHTLDNSILIISDNEKALDIAGIKGGDSSGVDENTQNLMLSAVNFDFKNIRESSRKLKLQTDASKRFENEVPQEKTIIAMNLMSYLLEKYAEAEVSEEIIDTKAELKKRPKIIFDFEKINSLLGTELTHEEIINILNRLEINIINEDNIFKAEVPKERLDLNIWQDLAEEVGRIYSLQDIEERMPSEEFKVPIENILKKTIYTISDILVQYGFFEVYNRTLNENGNIKLLNPLSSNADSLRFSLLPLLFKKGERNLIHTENPKFFEIGKVFLSDKVSNENKVVEEVFYFSGFLAKRKIKDKFKEDIFLETKGYLEKIFETLGVEKIKWEESEDKDFVARISKNEKTIGKVGINFWEINLEFLIEEIDNKIDYKKVSKYPTIKRDISFFVPENFKVIEAKNLIKNTLPKEAIEIEIFDIYKDKENKKKSFAFNIIFQSMDKTLNDEEINVVMNKVYETLKSNNFEIR